MLEQVFKRLKEKEITLDVTDRFKDRLVDEGFNPTYGARPLRRAVMRLLEDNLAEKMLNGDIGEGSSCIMDVNAAGEIPGYRRRQHALRRYGARRVRHRLIF